MTTAHKNTASRSGKNRLELRLAPFDNVCLANLCGAFDENLRQIETAFDITIARRGECFTLYGAPTRISRASEALQTFYARAKKAFAIDEIQLGLIELTARPAGKEAIPDSGAPALMTRKNGLYGRTPHQIDYLEKIQEHDITFGTGPAGTGKTYLAVASAVDAFERESVQR
ncbi:MAG: PhoH family protein, partial [Candidatus Accumulibacter sp.]|nr:PhoH family protein [Accumulibacter sp.]